MTTMIEEEMTFSGHKADAPPAAWRKARWFGVSAGLPLALALACLGTSLGAWAAQAAKVIRIGAVQTMHPTGRDENFRGFAEALAGAGFKEGVNVQFDRQFTEGDPARAEAIARKFNADKVNLVFSVGTLSTQAVLKVTPKIPVIFAAVTDPVTAGIVPADSATGKTTRTNTTGMSDGMASHRAMEVYARIVPSAKTWGTVFNPNEVNSLVELKAIREVAGRLGLRLIEVPVTRSGEVPGAVESLASRVQALVLLHDNTVRPMTATIAAVCEKRHLPLFGGIDDATSLAAYNVNYYLVGYAAGKKAALVFKGLDPGNIPWESAGSFRLTLNRKAADSLGITFPADLLRIADKVIE